MSDDLCKELGPMHFAIYRWHTPHALLFFGVIDPRHKHESGQLPDEVAGDDGLTCNLSSVFCSQGTGMCSN